MPLGGGTFTVQNKVLPGSYINFVSIARPSLNMGERGFAAMALELDWGADGAVFTVTKEDFQKNSFKLFGYDYGHEKLKGLRDLFQNVSTLYAYRLNSGEKAANTFAQARFSGTRGNDLKVVIAVNADDENKFDVSLYLDKSKVDSQTVAAAADLLDNDYVTWKKDADLAATAGTFLTGGTNKSVDIGAHQSFLDKIESYAFNILGAVTTESAVKQLYTSFTKRMRDEVGAKFQTVLHNQNADYEGVINVKNDAVDEGASAAALVYWVTGFEAALAVNKSGLNKPYTGEFKANVDYTQAELIQAIHKGEFTLHSVNGEVRVLEDINSLVTTTDEKGEVFKDNQTMRVIDQIANDVGSVFNNKYLGSVPNDKSGRISLWSDIVKHHQELLNIRAIEDFDEKDIVVEQGDSKKSVLISDVITVVNTMSKLYMTVRVG